VHVEDLALVIDCPPEILAQSGKLASEPEAASRKTAERKRLFYSLRVVTILRFEEFKRTVEGGQ